MKQLLKHLMKSFKLISFAYSLQESYRCIDCRNCQLLVMFIKVQPQFRIVHSHIKVTPYSRNAMPFVTVMKGKK